MSEKIIDSQDDDNTNYDQWRNLTQIDARETFSEILPSPEQKRQN